MIILTDGKQFLIEITLIIFSASSPSGSEQSLFANIMHASAFLILNLDYYMKIVCCYANMKSCLL